MLIYLTLQYGRIFMQPPKIAGVYSVTTFRQSVLPSSSVSVHIFLVTVAHIQLKFDLLIRYRNAQVVLEFFMVRWFLAEWRPFLFEKIRNFQLPFIISLTVLHIKLKFGIWMRQKNVQVKVEFCFGLMIFSRVTPISLWKKRRNFQFLLIISLTVMHIQLKFEIVIHQSNAQVEYEYFYGQMYFDRETPL
jgi:hypothetical protein